MEVKWAGCSSELQFSKRILSKLMQNLIFMCTGNVLPLVYFNVIGWSDHLFDFDKRCSYGSEQCLDSPILNSSFFPPHLVLLFMLV